jgi:hypothetical protein
MKDDVEIWVQRGTESENKAGFVVTGTCDQGENLLGSQKYQTES